MAGGSGGEYAPAVAAPQQAATIHYSHSKRGGHPTNIYSTTEELCEFQVGVEIFRDWATVHYQSLKKILLF